MDKHYLTPLFSPASIVVFAGDPDATDAATPCAKVLIASLKSDGFSGPVTYLDIHMSGTLADLAASRADLAIIALPHDQVAAALEVTGRIRCRAALVLGSNLGAAPCAELLAIARRHGVHLLGPNSLGFQRPQLKLNASAAGPLAAPGPLALISQSGALTSSILDWARRNAVGFSAVVSLGPNTAVDLPQVLDFLANDGSTQSILIYMEGIRQARRFMSALRAAAYAKPVVVMKAGRKPAGSRAALTHSAAIVGSDDVFDAALRRAGAVRV
ncbi:MAG: GNAT family N-acetyltransferase, partial [Burkholderiales bacterium PBB5]